MPHTECVLTNNFGRRLYGQCGQCSFHSTGRYSPRRMMPVLRERERGGESTCPTIDHDTHAGLLTIR